MCKQRSMAAAEDWRTPEKRRAIIQQLEDALRNCAGNVPPPSLQNPAGVEKSIYDSAKSEEEYGMNIRKVILMITRRPQPSYPAMQQQQQQLPSSQLMPAGAPRPTVSAPMHGMTSSIGIGRPPPQQAYQPSTYPQHQTMQHGVGMTHVPSPHPGPYVPSPHPASVMHPGMPPMHSAQRTMPPSNPMVQMGTPPQGPMASYQVQPSHPVPMQGSVTYPPPPQAMYSSGIQQRYSPQMARPPGAVGGMNPGMVGRPPVAPGMQFQQTIHRYPYSGEAVNTGLQSVTAVPNPSFSSVGGLVRPSAPHYTSPTSNVVQGNSSSSSPAPVPTPAAPTTQETVTHPPNTATSSSNPPTPRPNVQVASSPAPPTPLLPASPITGVGSPTQLIMTPEENEAYLKKLGELQRYLPFVSRMVNRLSKTPPDERRNDHYLKLRSLHNLLQDANRRVPLQTLRKCGESLERMFGSHLKELSDAYHSHSLEPPPSLPTTKLPEFSRLQSLLEPKMIPSPPPTYNTDEERHLAALELTIRQKGSLDKTIMQCVFVGTPRSGKSSLMKRMVGERPTLSSPSTGVANKVMQVEIVRSSTAAASVSGSAWVKLSLDDEAVTVVMDTAQSRSGQVAGNETSSVAIDSDVADLKFAVDFCRSALQKHLQGALRALQEPGWLVYLTDTGGQIEFQELLPLLVSGPSVFFLVFRLDHDLNKRFIVEYVRPNGTTSEPYQSNFTVKEALLQSLASIASMGVYSYRGKQVPLKPQVFFVGTHKDKVSQAEIDSIDHALQQLVTSTDLYHKEMIHFASESRMLLAVNNLSDDDSDIQLVQKAVERLGAQGGFNILAPPSWLIFSLIIRQNKDRILSYDQCFEVAKQCGIMTRGELNEALWFLHTKVGLIRHFQGLEDLQQIVIQDPQLLFDKITDLVVETFTFDKTNRVVQENFKKKGIFSFSTFEMISGGSDHLLTPSRLVKLLEHLHIIAPLEEEEEGERRYFMPCILAHAEPAETALGISVERSTEQHLNKSLLIGFKCGYCPKGVFAALVVYLLANTKAQWKLKKNRIFKDQISFSVGPFDVVSIKVWPKFLEITCTPASSEWNCNRQFPLAVTCREVRRCIETGIREVTSALHYTSDAAHYLAFYCTGDHQGSDPREPHPAEINFYGDIPCSLQCELEARQFKLPPGYGTWFDEMSESSGRQQQKRQYLGETGGGITLTGQDLHFLTEKLKPATPQWKAVGLALGFPDHELTTIEHKPLLIPEGDTGYFREMLSQWLKWAPPNHLWPTVENLAVAVRSSGHEGLAVQLSMAMYALQEAPKQPCTQTLIQGHSFQQPPQFMLQQNFNLQAHQQMFQAQRPPETYVHNRPHVHLQFPGPSQARGYPPSQPSQPQLQQVTPQPQSSTSQTLLHGGSTTLAMVLPQFHPDSAAVQQHSSDSGKELEGMQATGRKKRRLMDPEH